MKSSTTKTARRSTSKRRKVNDIENKLDDAQALVSTELEEDQVAAKEATDAKVSAGTLEERLQEKEELVGVLTERLERAADQLDRVHRTGGDRGGRVASGIPPEFIEEQRTVLQSLEQAVEQWQDQQAAAALGRIEIQVSELRDLLVDNLASGNPIPSAGGSAPSQTMIGDTQRQPSGSKQPNGSSTSSWESVKAAFLDGDGGSSPAPAGPLSSGSGTANAAVNPVGGQSSTGDFTATAPGMIEDVAAPEPIDFADASLEDLQQAVDARDDYISFLLKKVKSMNSNSIPSVDWQSLENAPEELKERLEQVEQSLREKLRFAEVDLSLERARMAREQSQLSIKEEQIQKRMKKLGMLTENDAATIDESDGKGRKWLNFLHRGQEGDNADE